MQVKNQEQEVKVGMGATEVVGTDRYAFTITKVVSPTRFEATKDQSIVVKGGYDPIYKYEPNPDGLKETVIKTPRGWKVVGQDIYFRIGKRMTYLDPNF